MATCNPTELLAAGKCFDCLDEGLKQTIKLQLLCEIANGAIRSYTLAELEAMSAAQARAVGVAYATDALNVKGVYGATGVLVFWDGIQWIDVNLGARAATTYGRLTLNARRAYGQTTIIHGASWNIAPTIVINATSGAGASTGTAKTPSTGGVFELISFTGTTTSGVGGFRSYLYPTSALDPLCRAHSSAHNHVTIEQSTGGDTFHARFTIETGGTTVATSVQTDMVGLVYDPSDILGFGNASDNWKALIRANSTTLDWVDTGIARTTPHWQIATFVPVSGTQAYFEVATALNDGSSYTVHASRTVTFSASTMCMTYYLAKASGTNTKSWNRQTNPAGLLWRVNNLTPSGYVF